MELVVTSNICQIGDAMDKKKATNRILLNFSNLDEVQQRLDLLSQNGYDQAGGGAWV